MKPLNPSLAFFLNMAKIHAVVTRRFDASLNGLSLTDFLILHHLSLALDEKMRRIDLAEAIGLTASGVTRLLAPMEKIGLVKREKNAQDARVSYVTLAPGGKRKLSETLEYAELLAQEILAPIGLRNIKPASDVLMQLSKVV